jgi:predicted phage tail component-like protein
MLESVNFHFKGIASKDKKVINCKVDSGLFEERFLPNRTINTVSIRGRDEEYFQSVKYDPVILPLTFYIEEELTEKQAHDLNRWLYSEYYEPFYFDDFPNRIYYVMYHGDTRLFHNGMQGYVTIEFISNSPYSYSPVYLDDPIDATHYDGITPIKYDIPNNGDKDISPEIWIKMVENGDVTINNLSNGDTFKFTDLAANETVYVDCKNEDVESDLTNTYRYNNFNKQYLSFVYGINRLEIHGKCTVQFRYRYKFLR